MEAAMSFVRGKDGRVWITDASATQVEISSFVVPRVATMTRMPLGVPFGVWVQVLVVVPPAEELNASNAIAAAGCWKVSVWKVSV